MEPVTMFGVPTHWGIGITAVGEGPRILRERGFAARLAAAGIAAADLGDIAHRPGIAAAHDPRCKHADTVARLSEKTAAATARHLAAGRRVLVLGGDHSLSIGTVAGAAAAFGSDTVGLVWIDAHGDINTPETTPSGNVHGMPLASLLGIGDSRLAAVGGFAPKIKRGNLIHIGGNNFDPPEKIIMERAGIRSFDRDALRAEGLAPVTAAIAELARRVPRVWVSVDLDAIDRTHAPGVSLQNADGLAAGEAIELARRIAKNANVCGADITEYNHANDAGGKTAALAADIAAALFKKT